MPAFSSPIPLPFIPDDLTIPQFMLTTNTAGRPARGTAPLFVEDATGRRVDYMEARKRTYDLANALSLKYKIGKDDVVCIFTPNHVDYPILVWAVHTLGGIVTPANPAYTAEELVHQLKLTGSIFIVAHPGVLDIACSAANMSGISAGRIALLDDSAAVPSSRVDGISHIGELVAFGSNHPRNFVVQKLKPGESKTKLALLPFSSGTTGKPKAVAISHYAVIANLIQMATHYRINDPTWKEKRMSPGDIAIAVLPFFHIYGLVVIMHYAIFCGMTLVVVPKFSLSGFLQSVVRHRVTHLYLVPPQVVLLCKHPLVKEYDLTHVKFCNSGAAPLSGELMQQLSAILCNATIGQGYGLTETSTTISTVAPELRIGVPGGAGQLMPGVIARVVKQDGSLAAEGEQGELIVTGPSMALGYFNNPEATKSTFLDGWVRTGDEVIIKNLQVYVVDRQKEIMKVRGFQVAPAELEGHLLQHPAVVDACVVGVPDDYSGEVPLAFVVLDAQTSRRVEGNEKEADAVRFEIAKHVSDAKVKYKRLAGGVVFIDTIPKNPSGKILRRLLRDRAKADRIAGKTPAKL